jgi:hypothetical protein
VLTHATLRCQVVVYCCTQNQSASSPRGQSPANGHRGGAGPASPQGGLEAVMSRHQSALEAAKAGSAPSVDYEAIKRAPPASVPGPWLP